MWTLQRWRDLKVLGTAAQRRCSLLFTTIYMTRSFVKIPFLECCMMPRQTAMRLSPLPSQLGRRIHNAFGRKQRKIICAANPANAKPRSAGVGPNRSASSPSAAIPSGPALRRPAIQSFRTALPFANVGGGGERGMPQALGRV